MNLRRITLSKEYSILLSLLTGAMFLYGVFTNNLINILVGSIFVLANIILEIKIPHYINSIKEVQEVKK